MAEELRVGIIGVGNIGSAHASHIYAGDVPGMRLAALCDTDMRTCRSLREQYPAVPVYDSHVSLLRDGVTDAVIIATPHYFHPEIAVDSFRAGQHVLSEKPAGVCTSSVRHMTAEAERSGKLFGIMFNQRTNPLFQRAREIVSSGELGELKRLVWIVTNWYRTQAYYDSGGWRATWNGEGGGVLINQAPHNLDLWQWIFGMPKRVRAFCGIGKYHRINVEDDAVIYAEYESGAEACFITTTGEVPGSNRLEISGDRGRLVLEDGVLKHTKLSESERVFCFTATNGFFKPDMTVSEYREEPVDGHIAILKNFADALLHGEMLISPGADGINELSISNAAYLSAWTDDWAELPPDEEKFEKLLEERRSSEKIPNRTEIRAEKIGDYDERWQVRW